MPEIAQQLHEIAEAIGKLSGAVVLLAVVIGVSDFDGKVAKAMNEIANAIPGGGK